MGNPSSQKPGNYPFGDALARNARRTEERELFHCPPPSSLPNSACGEPPKKGRGELHPPRPWKSSLDAEITARKGNDAQERGRPVADRANQAAEGGKGRGGRDTRGSVWDRGAWRKEMSAPCHGLVRVLPVRDRVQVALTLCLCFLGF